MKGIGTSPGIGIGKVFIYKTPDIKVIQRKIEDKEAEIKRLDKGILETSKEIDILHDLALKNMGKNEADIFTAHKMILEDPEFYLAVKEKINIDKINCEFAVKEVSETFISMFENIEDEYLKARAADIKDVTTRLLRVLLGIEADDLLSISEKSIIIAEDLTPSDTAQINKEMASGIVTEFGGRTSHTAIMARTMEIPAIAGVKDILKEVIHGDLMIIDGSNGEITINPTKDTIHMFENRIKESKEAKKKLQTLKGQETISKDGHKVELAGNIGTPKDIEKVLENDGEGVGLYRTEFLFMDRERIPTEEEQFQAYKIVAEKLDKRPLIIRTLDVGGDKEIPYLNLPKEMNPFLGYRAIRLCLDRKDIFRPQLRAILRASAYGNIKIMFPMISSIQEVREAKSAVEEIKEELRRENILFDESIEIGIMVEIPSVAIHSRIFAKEVDFFSIGTNDLVQYTLAVDRGNQNIANLYSHYHPAVLNLIRMTIENGHKEGIWVGMCGEAAGDEKLIPILLAMGLDEFSMSASSILKARYLIKNTSKKEVESKLDEILSLPTADDVERFISK
ncbi:phosphoenolpyruvate--protein phosphotransferase [Tissierella sp. Yu-01]|uniref:phosphoenolpyruvate--protein phosphotransferase n=1 Tax=Tissierella sp. Yu-01 TaxID=3035694 RepID=UPI00240E8D0D|nr:phosphoenolpyruvate--protein phosphotransferase [Tissierella sp. Yu-01]WFA08405.1 phosphoenolpyruvate--protein phosphotransferase [Tissierella sp. Yu-01]